MVYSTQKAYGSVLIIYIDTHSFAVHDPYMNSYQTRFTRTDIIQIQESRKKRKTLHLPEIP